MKIKEEARYHRIIDELYSDLIMYEMESLKRGLGKDITFHEIHTVEIVGHLGEGTMRQIADRARVKQSTMTVMIDKLIRKGLVQRNRSEKDRRIVLVSLSEKGEKAHKEYDRLHHKVTKVWLEALSEEEQQQLVVILQKVSQALSS